MRYLLTLILIVTGTMALVAQTTQYVWAPSGLTLRAEGKPGAEKIMVLPHGGKVQLTGNIGERTRVKAFSAFSLDFYESTHKSLPWDLEDQYVEVLYQETQGWVFAGYLFRFPPPEVTGNGRDIFAWLESIAGPQQKILHAEMSEVTFRDQTVLAYQQGITVVSEYGEGWGGTTWSFPLGTINDGYLLGETFFNLSDQLIEARDSEGAVFMILERADRNELLFSEEMGAISIRVVGGMLLITSEGGC